MTTGNQSTKAPKNSKRSALPINYTSKSLVQPAISYKISDLFTVLNTESLAGASLKGASPARLIKL
jgi:hypothetical protein